MKRLLALALVWSLGCGGAVPQFSPKNQTFLKKMQKQISTKRTQATEQLCKRAEEMHAKNELTDEQFSALEKICGKVNDGRWEEAEELVQALIDGQGKE